LVRLLLFLLFFQVFFNMKVIFIIVINLAFIFCLSLILFYENNCNGDLGRIIDFDNKNLSNCFGDELSGFNFKYNYIENIILGLSLMTPPMLKIGSDGTMPMVMLRGRLNTYRWRDFTVTADDTQQI